MTVTSIRHGAAVKAVALAVVLLACVVLASVPTAHAAYGDNFGIVDSQGAAFPGPKAFWAGTCDMVASDEEVGSAPASPADCMDYGTGNAALGVQPWVTPPSWRLAPTTEAGAHPDGTTTFWFNRFDNAIEPRTDGNMKDGVIRLPAGFVGDPSAIPQCPSEVIRQRDICPPETQVGVATLSLTMVLAGYTTGRYRIYNAEPRKGKAAEFIINRAAGATDIPITAEVRTDGDFGVTTMSISTPSGFPLHGAQVTLWGTPWAASHDRWRAREGYSNSGENGSPLPANGLNPVDQAPYDPSWGPINPFLSNPTECSGASPTTTLAAIAWQNPTQAIEYTSDPPPVTDCHVPPFDPQASFQPTSLAPDSASGLDADITVPPNDQPPAEVATNPDDATGAPAYWKSEAGRATAQLQKTVVTLPEGMSVNPSAAAGLEACSDADIGVTAVGSPYLFDNEEPTCPDGATIGTVEASTPVLSEKLAGEVILGQPKSTDPESGDMFRLFLVLRNEERGLIAKVFGSAVADPETGQLTATFDKNPRVPVENIHVELKGGQRGLLAQPQSCGTKTTDSEFTPWTAAHGGGGPVRALDDSFTVAGNCSFGFAPALIAGMDTQAARGTGTFAFNFARQDGQQWFRSLTAQLPQGLLARVKDVPLCSDAQASAGACPEASRIGSVDAGAGSGNPFFLERKGDVYLTEGYKGGAYGLMVRVPVEAGPFRGEYALSPIVVRQAIHVDRSTAQVSAVSDPFPTIWHGVPLRVRQVTVEVDRPNFMLNPSSCSAKQVGASIVSAEGAAANLSEPFQAAGCVALPFKPKLGLALTGKRQVTTGTHPGVRAVVRQDGVGEAGIEKAIVRLPKSLALDPENAQALCEFADGIKPDLENHCPKGSIVGRARAKTPLLHHDLAGDVYFVKNVRKDPRTGNLIRTLPMLIVALRGEIAVNLKGESSTTKNGRLVNTFASVPDAPISQFNLNIAGGKSGILAVTQTRKGRINVCAARQIAEADMDGQNGRRHDFDARIKTPCTKKQRAAAKRAAKRASRARRS